MRNMTFKKISNALISFTLIIPLLGSAAAGATPAQFGNALSELSAKIRLPDAFEGGFKTASVYCQTDVSVNGELTDTQCFQHPKIADLRQQTLDALQDITFVPATVDDSAVPVRMQFRVVYSRSGEQPDIMLLANLGTLQSELGVDYIAPQERLDHPDWYQQYTGNPWAKGKAFFNKGRLTRVIGTIKTSGKVSDVSVLDARGSGKRDADFVEEALEQSKFIPGFVGSQPTEMHYVAVLNYAD